MRVTKIKDQTDLFDLVTEKTREMTDIGLGEFNQAVATGFYDGKRVVRACESRNFGYITTEDGKVYRC